MPITAKTTVKVGGKTYKRGETIPESAFAGFTKPQLTAMAKSIIRQPKPKPKKEEGTENVTS